MNKDQLIAEMFKALEWYRIIWTDHPKDFALDYLAKDRGEKASTALYLWEMYFDQK